MNYKIDTLLDGILLQAIDSGIKSATGTDSYYLDIIFNDGSQLSAWNVNKYYGWLSLGCFIFPNNEKYSWQSARPSRATMAKLYDALNEVSY
jgi:hypothetical protein